MQNENQDCTGILFRGTQGQYFNKDKQFFEYRESFRLLKTKSCKCKTCQNILTDLEEEGSERLHRNSWFESFNHDPIENGATYRLKVLSWDSDWSELTGESWSYPDKVKMEIVK